MGEAGLGLSGAEENRVLEGLIVFLTEWAEGARISVPPGDMGSQVAGTCAHQVNAATYKSGKGSKGVRCEAGTVRIQRGYWRTHVQPVAAE